MNYKGSNYIGQENTVNIGDRINRIWEIDFVRGVAIICMVILHFIFVTSKFYGLQLIGNENLFEKFIAMLQNYGGIIFIFISGISSTFSKNNFKRGSQLFLIAMAITYVTIVFDNVIMVDNNNYVVRFGILHFLSVCMMLAPFFIKARTYFLLPLSLVIIIFGNYCRAENLLWFDLPDNVISIPALTGYEIIPWFRSADYFPLLPYIGYFIIGIIVGRIVYKNKTSIFKSAGIAKNFIIRFFTFCGKHTLAIYLIHQPVLFGTMEILNYMGLVNK